MLSFLSGSRFLDLFLACRVHGSRLSELSPGALTGVVSAVPATRVRGINLKLRPKPPLEASHPAAAQALRQMQRDHRTRLLSTMVGAPPNERAVALEDGVEGNLLLHTIAPSGSLTLAAGWLGSGRRKYVWVPLRPPLAWISTPSHQDPAAETIALLKDEEVASLAADLHLALDQLDQRHVIEEFLAPDPIPPSERRAVVAKYTQLLGNHGWEVTLDPSETRRSLLRTTNAHDPKDWPQADREELTRLEALLAEALKGVRSTSRVLYQNK